MKVKIFSNKPMVLPTEDVRKFFDEKWNVFDGMDESLYTTGNVNLSKNSLLTFLLNFLDKAKPVIDLGCGDGRNSIFLTQNGFENIEACDFSEQGVKRLDAIAKNHGYEIKTYVQDLKTINLETDKYGSIICASVLHYFTNEEIRTLFQKINEALLDGGYLYLTFEADLKLSLDDGRTFAFENQPQRTVDDYIKLVKEFFSPLGYTKKKSKVYNLKALPSLAPSTAKKLNTTSKTYTRQMNMYEIILKK